MGVSCWSCRIGLALFATAVVLATGGLGIPALGGVLATVFGVSAATGTAAAGAIVGMTFAAAVDWLCCLLGVTDCCEE